MPYITLDDVDQVIKADRGSKAVLVRFNDLTEKWIPRSVCEDGDNLSVGDADVVVAEWFADKEGLV